MGNEFFFNWEPRLMSALQTGLGDFLIKFFAAVTEFGDEMVVVAVLCFLYFVYDKESAKYIARRVLPVNVINPMIKNVACRLRPYFVHDQVAILKPVDAKADIYDVAAQGYSFPSGHSSTASALYLSMAVYFKKFWITAAAITLVFFVGVSRFCLGAHYPTDVFAGWLLGIVVILAAGQLEKLLKQQWKIYILWSVVGLAGMFYCTTNDFFTSYGIMLGFFAADLFETGYVKFETTKNPIALIFRFAGGIVIYFALNFLLKLPFSKEFLESGVFLAYLTRVLRYAVILFVTVGIYPMLFKKAPFK